DLLGAGHGARVEPEHRALGRLDGPVTQLHRDLVLQPLEAQGGVDADAQQVATAILERLDEGMNVADLGAGQVNGVPRLLDLTLPLSRGRYWGRCRCQSRCAPDQSQSEDPQPEVRTRTATRP